MNIEVPTAFDDRDWDDGVPREDDGGSTEPLRFASVGLGWFGGDVGPNAIVDADYCELTTLVSGSAEKAQRVADEFDADHALTYEEYADGAAVDAYDAVYIATPNACHLPHAETAAELGKHVLCEKPLEATADRARRMVEACEEAGVELMAAYRIQAKQSARWIRSLLRDGVVGDPVQIHGEFAFSMFPGADPEEWRLDANLARGGALMDIGVYPMNTARFFLDADPIAVDGTVTGSREEFADVDEHVAFQLEFPDDVTASCTASYNADGANRMSIMGTEGTIVAEGIFDLDSTRTIDVYRSGNGTSVEADEPDQMVEEFDYFAAGVRGDHQIEPDGRHALVDLEIAEAVYESDERGKTVEL